MQRVTVDEGRQQSFRAPGVLMALDTGVRLQVLRAGGDGRCMAAPTPCVFGVPLASQAVLPKELGLAK